MPRVVMTRLARLGLGFLLVYLVFMLGLIIYKFIISSL